MRELLIGRERVRHEQHVRALNAGVFLTRAGVAEQDARRARRHGIRREILAVEPLALERDEECARLDLARIRHDRGECGHALVAHGGDGLRRLDDLLN